jgi:amino acid adenylation domain-containing protein
METGSNHPIASIPGRFAAVVARHAGRIAISTPDTQWTYAELDQRSTALAAGILDRLGDATGPVALLMEHDAPLLAAILGVLKAGKMYLALDPASPAERSAAMLADAGAGLLLTDQRNAAPASSLAAGRLRVWEIAAVPAPASMHQTLPEVSPAADAWLLYTSGSTGTPKGVWLNHRGIVFRTEAYSELITIAPDDRLSLLASCSLGTSATPLFGALLNGAAVCPFHVRSQGVERLADWLPRQRVTIYQSVPTVFRHLARAPGGKRVFEDLRLIRLDGEPVSRGDFEICRQHSTAGCRRMHALSSTETGLICAWLFDHQTTLPEGRVPVGRPVRGVEVSLLDGQGRPVKAGEEGQIVVRSRHLSQGYWRNPEATGEKFRAADHDPLYRIFVTSDLGRFLPDGALEHLGRTDQMVKIRGQRVDLGEVESALRAVPSVQEAAIVAREDSAGERRLVAYVVPRAGADASPRVCRRALREQLLLEHMVPNIFVSLDQLPQTAGGKIDRQALPPPPDPNKSVARRSERPRDVVETNVARIWESVLNVSPIGRQNDFFDLGGTSIQSAQVLAQIEEAFGASLPPSILTEHGTIEKLAALLAGYVVIPSPTPLVVLRDAGAGRPLFLIHSGQGDVASYGLLVRRLPGRPIYGLQSVGLQGESWPLMNVPAMARRYLPEILAKDPTGPYLLGATCMGGMVALELAQMLVHQGREVGLVALFDVSCPPSRWGHPDRTERLWGPIRDPVRNALRRLRWFFVRAAGLGRHDRWLPAYRRFVAHMNSRAYRACRPAFYPGTLTLCLTADTKYPEGDTRLMMRRHAREARVITVPGNRTGLFVRPAVDELARQIQNSLEFAERKPPIPSPDAERFRKANP